MQMVYQISINCLLEYNVGIIAVHTYIIHSTYQQDIYIFFSFSLYTCTCIKNTSDYQQNQKLM